MIIAFPLAKVAVYIVNGNVSPVFLWNSNISWALSNRIARKNYKSARYFSQISLKYDFHKGTRRMRLLDPNHIRRLRDVCV